MKVIVLQDGADFEGWRHAARNLLLAEVPPEQVTWLIGGEASLLTGVDEWPASSKAKPATRIPAAALGLMQTLICHSDPQRYGLAYRLLWRLSHGERNLLQLITDPDVVRARNAEKSVRRDSHKMKAFVRFREVKLDDEEPVFVAWFEPQHYVVERVAPFFVRRFTGMRWSILTPYRSAHWNGETLHFSTGCAKADAPREDAMEDYWRTYFASTFNPARLKVKMMKSEMPMKYWKNLPEASLIPQLIQDARPRMAAMIQAAPTEPNLKIPAPGKAPAQAMNVSCDCGLPMPYVQCCGRWHAGEPAPTAEALMRSRYSAFVRMNVDYLLASWHPHTRPASLQLETGTKWLGLQVLTHQIQGPDRATVEFVARSRRGGGRAERHHEVSSFVREEGRWLYVTASS